MWWDKVALRTLSLVLLGYRSMNFMTGSKFVNFNWSLMVVYELLFMEKR